MCFTFIPMIVPRFKLSYTVEVSDFNSEILIVCPGCERQAIVRRNLHWKFNEETFKASCFHCGFNKKYYTNLLPVTLWLRRDIDGRVFYALNHAHLVFLKNHIGALLRERNGVPKKNSSIGSRLPRWMTSKKNREKVLNCIEKLEDKADQ